MSQAQRRAEVRTLDRPTSPENGINLAPPAINVATSRFNVAPIPAPKAPREQLLGDLLDASPLVWLEALLGFVVIGTLTALAVFALWVIS